MNSFELEFNLKQWTPMIHFQSKIPGATLRATDVKPRLDSFIYEWRKKRNKEVPESWLIEKDKKALNYKLFTINQGQNQVDDPLREVFFGNMNCSESEKRSTVTSDDLKIKIICFNTELKNTINECIETFFLINNFGSRSSRGSGSFTLKKTNRIIASKLLKQWYGNKPVYKLEYKQNVGVDIILKDGALIYQILKSGINFNNIYIKSFLTKYFLRDKDTGGEKRFLKQNNIAPIIGRKHKNDEKQVTHFKYIRGLLGSSDTVSYLNSPSNTKDKTTVSISPSEDSGIKRIPSPVFYKICDNTLFIIPRDINPNILGKEFKFSSDRAKDIVETLSIPEDFDIDDMMKKYVSYLNGEESAKDYRFESEENAGKKLSRFKNRIKRCE